MRKTLQAILTLCLFISLIAGCSTDNASRDSQNKEIYVGAILALSGPSALWGQSVRNGMELALEDHPEIKVIFEDSKGQAADGITAYNKLENEKVDVFVSALSSVAIPLANITNERKIPMIVTQSAADNLTNEYTFRYYSDSSHFATPSFDSADSPLKGISKIAVLYRQDYYAESVAKKIKALSAEQGKEIVFFESYAPNDLDFSSSLQKVAGSSAEAFLYIPVPPSESLAILKRSEEIGLKIPILEVSNVLSDPTTRSKAPNMTFYTEQFAFSIPGNSEEFKTRYSNKYGIEPNFVAAFGYDIVNLISTCKKGQIKECLADKREVTGVTGTAKDIKNNDILLPMYLMRVDKTR